MVYKPISQFFHVNCGIIRLFFYNQVSNTTIDLPWMLKMLQQITIQLFLICCNFLQKCPNQLRWNLDKSLTLHLKPIFTFHTVHVLSTSVPNTFKEINQLIFRAIVKTDKFGRHNCVFYIVFVVLVNFVASSFGRVLMHHVNVDQSNV